MLFPSSFSCLHAFCWLTFQKTLFFLNQSHFRRLFISPLLYHYHIMSRAPSALRRCVYLKKKNDVSPYLCDVFYHIPFLPFLRGEVGAENRLKDWDPISVGLFPPFFLSLFDSRSSYRQTNPNKRAWRSDSDSELQGTTWDPLKVFSPFLFRKHLTFSWISLIKGTSSF